MISASDRRHILGLIREAVESGARERKACEILHISLRTIQRWRSEQTPNEDQRPLAQRKEPAHKLSIEEEEEIVRVMNEPAHKSMPPSQIVPRLADQGTYLASESTFYRILHRRNMQHHRGRSRSPNRKRPTTYDATKANQVWMWDITWLPGPIKGQFTYLYMIVDLYSRKIVGWEIWAEESAEHASELVRRAVVSESLVLRTEPLVLHSDNGSPMKAATFLETLYRLGIVSSRGRPRVSDDNPYIESLFKTCKYRPEYPEKGFATIGDTRDWVMWFVQWYNGEHRHSGLNYITPNQRHEGTCEEIFAQRTRVYEEARRKRSSRWARGVTRNWSLADTGWLNPDRSNSNGRKECEKEGNGVPTSAK